MKKISRRDFLKASAATSGGALLTACGSSGSSTLQHQLALPRAAPVLSVTGLTWQIHPVPMSKAWATYTAGRQLRPTLVST
jgi:anaerobic selenocysteine-containing dehydrogenase